MAEGSENTSDSGFSRLLYAGRILLCLLSFGFIYPHAMTEGMNVKNPTLIEDEEDKNRRK